MANQSKIHFLELNDVYRKIIERSYESECEPKLAELYQFIEDLTYWHKALTRFTDTTLLVNAIQEYEIAFQAAVSGQYRHAFSATRYFLEQACKFVYLSSNEFKLRQWKAGHLDISWSSIIDNENGIFSKNHIRVFFPDIETEGAHIQSLVKKLYRETSEFVHGNFSNICSLDTKFDFRRELLSEWLNHIETAKFAVVFILSMRFAPELVPDDLSTLEDCIREELCEIEGIQYFLGR